MIDYLMDLTALVTLRGFLIGVAIFVVTFAFSLGVVTLILVKLPTTYFKHNHPRDFWSDRHPTVRLLGVIGKNLLGLLLVGLGIVMSIPGVPGQGILTVLLGIMLLDFPGKRRLEFRLVSRPKVLKAINRLRHRFGKPALVLD